MQKEMPHTEMYESLQAKLFQVCNVTFYVCYTHITYFHRKAKPQAEALTIILSNIIFLFLCYENEKDDQLIGLIFTLSRQLTRNNLLMI